MHVSTWLYHGISYQNPTKREFPDIIKTLPRENSLIWVKAFKDNFNLITFLQNYIHQLQIENIVCTIEGQSAVIVTKNESPKNH